MTDGTMNTIVQRVYKLLEVDAATNDLVDGFRRLNRISDEREGVYINVHPRREQKVSVQTSNAKGRELWRFDITIDVGFYMSKGHYDKHPTEQVPDITSVGGAVWDAIQGNFLLDGSTPFLDIPMRLDQIDYDDDFLVTEDGGIMWETKAVFQCQKYVNNPT